MFTKDIGIDLGTANTLVYMRGKGIIIREPSVVAVNTRTDKCRYVGKEAKDVIGRTPGSIVAVRPLKDGVIADFDITTTMLQEFIKKALRGTILTKANVIICIPSGVTAVVGIFFGVVAISDQHRSLAIASASTVGATLGFLVYNLKRCFVVVKFVCVKAVVFLG